MICSCRCSSPFNRRSSWESRTSAPAWRRRAEQVYRQILQYQPDQPDALNLLGVLLFQSGQLRDGMELVQRAVTVSPEVAEFHNNFGVISQALGNLAEAEKQFRLAAQLKPDYAEAMNNLGAMVG